MRDTTKVEDCVALLDVSRSMLKTDFKPNRLNNAIETLKNFIHSKLSLDPSDKIALITFGGNAKRLVPFTNEETILINSFQKIRVSGRGNISQGISFSIQLLIKEMQKLGGKISRIFILTDNKIIEEDGKLNEIVEVAKGLGVYVDVCQIGKTEDYRQSKLKLLTRQTGGEYGYFNNTKALVNSGKSFASKKELKFSRDYFARDNKSENAPLLNEIALPLKRPSVLELKAMINSHDTDLEKCQICHSMKSPVTNADLYSEGRICPSCEHPMHLSCAAMWAKGTEYSESVFRCPFCYYLLKIPTSALKIAEIRQANAQNTTKDTLKEHKQTRMKLIPNEEVESIYGSCSYCRNIFMGEHDVYQCEQCGAYYHEPCLQKMFKELKSCRNCGAQIV